MKKELDIYWEECVISNEEKDLLLKRYNDMLEDTINSYNCLEKNYHYSWAIITGYYIMFYKTLILLAKNHNLKPKNFESHSQVVHALHVLYDKKKVADLLDMAYNKIKYEHIPGNLLYKGKSLRNKVNYITKSDLPKQEDLNNFSKNIKNKFIEIIDILTYKNDN